MEKTACRALHQHSFRTSKKQCCEGVVVSFLERLWNARERIAVPEDPYLKSVGYG